MAMDLSFGNSLESIDPDRISNENKSETDSDEGRFDSSPLRNSPQQEIGRIHSFCQCHRNFLIPRTISPNYPKRNDFQTPHSNQGECVENRRLENDAVSMNSGKRFSIEDILRPDFGNVGRTSKSADSLSQRGGENERSTASALLTSSHPLIFSDHGMAVLHAASGLGGLNSDIPLNDRLRRGAALLRPSPLFAGVPHPGIFRTFDIESPLTPVDRVIPLDEHLHHRPHAVNGIVTNETLPQVDDDVPIPKRLRELVQRDPKRQTGFRYRDNNGSTDTADRFRDFPREFPGISLDILGDVPGRAGETAGDSGRSEEGADEGDKSWPAWVYCTRYSDRPSAGPRARKMKRNKSSGDTFVMDTKRPRTAFSDTQLVRLREEFHKNHYLTEDRRKGLAWELGLGETQVKIWFQNKRAKMKKTSDHKTNLAEELTAHGLYNHSVS